jgi:hypothetical protein
LPERAHDRGNVNSIKIQLAACEQSAPIQAVADGREELCANSCMGNGPPLVVEDATTDWQVVWNQAQLGVPPGGVTGRDPRRPMARRDRRDHGTLPGRSVPDTDVAFGDIEIKSKPAIRSGRRHRLDRAAFLTGLVPVTMPDIDGRRGERPAGRIDDEPADRHRPALVPGLRHCRLLLRNLGNCPCCDAVSLVFRPGDKCRRRSRRHHDRKQKTPRQLRAQQEHRPRHATTESDRRRRDRAGSRLAGRQSSRRSNRRIDPSPGNRRGRDLFREHRDQKCPRESQPAPGQPSPQEFPGPGYTPAQHAHGPAQLSGRLAVRHPFEMTEDNR